jgi:hypothetical protein
MAHVNLALKLPPTFSDSFVLTWEIVNGDLEVVQSGSFFDRTHDSVQLSPGKYWLRVQLPGSQTQSRSFVVPAEDSVVNVDVQLPIPSRNEWLGWATVTEASSIARSPRPMAPILKDVWVKSWVLEDGWRVTDGAVKGQLFAEEGLYQLEVTPGVERLHALQIGGESIRSRFVMIPAVGTTRMMLTASEAGTLQIVVSLRNSVADHLARYLRTATPSSWEGLDLSFMKSQGRDLLGGKVSDPVGAAVGGYFLVQNRGEVPLSWLKNLAEWHQWMADGAIQYAYALLSTKGSKEAQQARSYLSMAAKRGYPVFFRGVELFLDAYRMLQSSKETRSMPRDLELWSSVYAWVRDSAAGHSTFTSFYGDFPATPETIAGSVEDQRGQFTKLATEAARGSAARFLSAKTINLTETTADSSPATPFVRISA